MEDAPFVFTREGEAGSELWGFWREAAAMLARCPVPQQHAQGPPARTALLTRATFFPLWREQQAHQSR